MSFLVFTNPGQIDPMAMLTFGVSAKANDSAIGMFGTGFKYAVAVLLRNGFKFTVFSGDKSYSFDTQEQTIRDQQFNIVHMNGEPVNFTTDLGKFWEPWMAVRELASNALDEGGEWCLTNIANHDNIGTTIVISGAGVDQLYTECSDLFLSTPALAVGGPVNIHPGQSSWVYYRGIRAMKLDQPSMYTYNILEAVTLTEDRTIKYSWDVQSMVTRSVNLLQNKDMMTRLVCAPENTYERDLRYDVVPSDLLKEVVADLMTKFRHVPKSLLALCQNSLIKTLSEKDALALDAVDQQRLDKAVSFAERIGFNVSMYPIIVTAHLGDSVLGRAVDDKIYISKRTFQMGTKMLVGTLIEEFLHLSEGVEDYSLGMQNLLFDTICSLGERITGEVL